MSKPIEHIAKIDEATQVAYQQFLEGLPVRDPSNLLFINVPQVPADLFLPETAARKGYYTYPPVGYLYLAAAAKQVNPDIELEILDLHLEMLRRSRLYILDDLHEFWKELIAEAIARSGDVHVCVGNNWAIVTPTFLTITKFIKENFKDVTLLTGGVETTQNYERVVKGDFCHVAFRYDAESAFSSFLESCRGTGPQTPPDGIAFKFESAFYETSPAAEPSKEFLDIRPYYDLLNLDNYREFGDMNPYSRYSGKDQIFATVLSNRGCRANCTYCGVLAFYPGAVRSRTPRSVVDEIKFLVEEKGVRIIDWLDDDLVFSKKQSVELFKLMAEELPDDFEWTATNGITGCAITEEIMYWMVQSGCKAFRVGVESGSEAMLRKIKKPATKDGLRQAGAIFSKYPKVFVNGNYMLGFPEETFGEIMETFDFANELSWDWASFSICQPAHGTPIFDAFQALGDDRCDETHVQGPIPARLSPQGGDFGYRNSGLSGRKASPSVVSGRAVFDLPRELIPSQAQLAEIWFTFNIETNFFNNKNFKPGGNLEKIARWFESIHSAYPRDASMCAMLAYAHSLLGNNRRAESYRLKFHELCEEYDYWQRRVDEFPELLEYANSPVASTNITSAGTER